MGICRVRVTQGLKNIDLPRRIVHMIVPTNDMRDGHVNIVHHNAKVISGRAIGASNHQIIQLFIRNFYQTLDLVIP